ncbi:MAG: class II aldolase/adducin family protein [Armatimonadetes bacterium]|nr:class II aldolase/adducin family protein [Armatimonadota bacterium]MDW8029419.1 class II aldolase/adducin family protein [Armatimonadota bacterium]
MDWHSELLLRQEIVKVGKRLKQEGLVAHTDGNISVRLDANWILITPSGVNKGELKPNQILKVNLSDGEAEGLGKPSVETPFHLAIYKSREDVNAVVHAHPPYATAFAAAGISLKEPIFPEMVVRFGEIPLVPYATPGTERLAELVGESIRDHEALLLQNHGAITVGQNLEEACGLMEALEWTAKVFWLAKALGELIPLRPSEIARLAPMRSNPFK